MILVLLLSLIYSLSVNCEVDSAIRYQSQSDSGSYRFGYDTGLSRSQQFHRQFNDNNNQMRPRFGYTDTNGKPPRIFHFESRSSQNGNAVNNNNSINTDNIRRQSVWRQRNNLSERSPNIPIYSRDYYKPTNIAISDRKPIPTRTPILIRKYRESGNSRIYYAGRDYGTAPTDNSNRNGHIVPITSVVPIESPRPIINRHFSRQPISSIPISPIGINPISANSIIGSHTYRSESAAVPSTVVAARSHTHSPVVYSGRGIPSPSAAARLRAQLLKVSDKPVYINSPE